MPSKQLRGTEGRKRRLVSRLHCLMLPSEPTRNQLQSAAPMPSKQLHNKVLAGGCETAKHHGPEGRNAPAGTYNVAVWTDKKLAPKCSSHALKTAPQRSPSGRLRNSPSPHRNIMLLKDGTTSKNMLPQGLTSLLDPSGFWDDCSCWACCCCCSPAAAGGAAGAGAASLQNAPFATPKHHANEGRNDLQKHAAPRLDVPSGFW